VYKKQSTASDTAIYKFCLKDIVLRRAMSTQYEIYELGKGFLLLSLSLSLFSRRRCYDAIASGWLAGIGQAGMILKPTTYMFSQKTRCTLSFNTRPQWCIGPSLYILPQIVVFVCGEGRIPLMDHLSEADAAATPAAWVARCNALANHFLACPLTRD
jgi:hypothetical protein